MQNGGSGPSEQHRDLMLQQRELLRDLEMEVKGPAAPPTAALEPAAGRSGRQQQPDGFPQCAYRLLCLLVALVVGITLMMILTL